MKTFEDYDALFRRWQEKHGGGFAEFSATRIVKALKQGRPHPTLSLDPERDAELLESAGTSLASVEEAYRAATGTELPAGAVICDFGCGSLRLGRVLIERQAPARYIGLDVSAVLLRRFERDNRDLLDEKAPLIGTIDDCLDMAVDREPDVTLAYNVAAHVHPDEMGDFFDRLRRLAGKPGALVLLHILRSDKPVRFQRSGWAWPEYHFRQAMEPLQEVWRTPARDLDPNSDTLDTFMVVYRRIA